MVYLDNNATTEIAPEAVRAMLGCIEANYGNPSSGHRPGREARELIENARKAVASMLGARSPDEIVFTSGGTESDNWAIRGAIARRASPCHVVTTRVEHEAVRKLCKVLESDGNSVSWIEVDEQGSLDLGGLRQALRPDTAIVSVMMSNNETGVLFPVAEIAEIVKERSSALVHVDGVNAAGKVPIDLKNTAIDLFSISAHKFHGPKGIGALYVRSGVDLPPMLTGGGQETGRRPGTEAVHQIAGLGAAATLAADLSPMLRIRELRDTLEQKIFDFIPKTSLNGTSDPDRRLPNTTNISFAGANGEVLMSMLDDAGIFVSTGSACNSASHTASEVLSAMNIPYLQAMGAIRFSLGRYNTVNDIDTVLRELPGAVERARSFQI